LPFVSVARGGTPGILEEFAFAEALKKNPRDKLRATYAARRILQSENARRSPHAQSNSWLILDLNSNQGSTGKPLFLFAIWASTM
jgi:hypothetical protein